MMDVAQDCLHLDNGGGGLVGTHPAWPESASADPLVIEAEGSRYPSGPIREYFEETFTAWREWSAQNADAGSFVLPLAPDWLHKANISGGAPYGIILPDACVDGLFAADTTMPFVSYLNWVFRWRPRSGVNETTGVGSPSRATNSSKERTCTRACSSIAYRPYPPPHR